jgi:hypothetical protein
VTGFNQLIRRPSEIQLQPFHRQDLAPGWNSEADTEDVGGESADDGELEYGDSEDDGGESEDDNGDSEDDRESEDHDGDSEVNDQDSEDHDEDLEDNDGDSEDDAPQQLQLGPPLRFDRPDNDGSILKTAEFLVDNMLKFQGCPPKTHNRTRQAVRVHMRAHKPKPIILNLDSLLKSFAKRIPEPSNLIPAGKWLDPSHPDIPSGSMMEQLACGTFDEHQDQSEDVFETIPVQISLAYSESRPSLQSNRPLSVAYDVDSFLAFPTSLAVASSGLSVMLYPSFVLNIRTDLHVQITLPETVESSRRSVKIRDIPHFLLGRLVGLLKIDVYILLPGLYTEDRPTNFPSQFHLEQFFDRIFLPAIYENLDATYLQHLPGSYEDAKLKALAASSERLSGASRSQAPPRVQYLHYHLPSESLSAIWDGVRRRVRLPGNRHFQGVQLLLNSKNTKMETKQPTPLVCFTDFLQRLSQSCDGRYLRPRMTYIDYGKETVYPVSRFESAGLLPDDNLEKPHVHLWRRCCLESFIRNAQNRCHIQRGGFKTTYYHWSQTKEAADLTVTPNKTNLFHRGGLIYSQFYASTKEIFDSAKTFPFDNPALEALAVDPYLTKATQMVGGGQGIDLGKVGQSYLRSRDRTLEALRKNAGKSYGVREEHRVNLELLQAIAALLETPAVRLQAVQPITPGIGNPFFFLPTEHIFEFLQYNCLRFILPFESIARSTASGQHVPWEKTKLMVMLLRCLPSAFDTALLHDKSALWKSQVTDASTGSQKFGLGLEETLEKFGFCWLLQGRIDWLRKRLAPTITEKFIFNDRDLLKSYKARWRRVYTVQDTYLEVNNLARLLKRCYQVDYKDGSKRILDHFNVICIRTYRQDVWLALKALVIFKDMEDEQKCLNGDVALTHHSIDSRRDREKFTWFFPQPCNKHNFTTLDIVHRTWFFDNKERRVWEKPYRQLFQHCVQALSRATSKSKAIEWAHQFPAAFLKYNWTFPQPSKHSFLVRDSKRSGKPLSFHTAIHIDHGLESPGLDWDDESRWEVGDAEWYLEGQAPTLPRDTASRIVQHVEQGLEQIRRRR